MSTLIPESHRDLLEGPYVATLATLMPDNQPQLSIIWCTYDGEYILFNTARGRQKDKNLSARPVATVLVVDPDYDRRFIEVRGEIVEYTEEGGIEMIDQLCELYTGKAPFFGTYASAERAETEVRVTARLKPSRVNVHT